MRLPSFSLIRFKAWLAMLAVLLQLAAMPLANAHTLQNSLGEIGLGNLELITICTPSGNKLLMIGQDGQPLKEHISKTAQCAICFVGGAAPLLLSASLELVNIAFVVQSEGQRAPAPRLADAGTLWPWSHGPPPVSVLL